MNVKKVVLEFCVLCLIGCVGFCGFLIVWFHSPTEGKNYDAQSQLKNLECAMEAYKLHKGDYPINLLILADSMNGKPPYIEERILWDPWDREILYERDNRSPKNGRPRIISLGPDPNNPEGRITNW